MSQVLLLAKRQLNFFLTKERFMKMLKGSQLHINDRNYVLSAYVNRLVLGKMPRWAKESGQMAMFLSDSEWLENTSFAVTSDGRLDRRFKHCQSSFPKRK